MPNELPIWLVIYLSKRQKKIRSFDNLLNPKTKKYRCKWIKLQDRKRMNIRIPSHTAWDYKGLRVKTRVPTRTHQYSIINIRNQTQFIKLSCQLLHNSFTHTNMQNSFDPNYILQVWVNQFLPSCLFLDILIQKLSHSNQVSSPIHWHLWNCHSSHTLYNVI